MVMEGDPKRMNSMLFHQISYFEISWAVGETKWDNSLTEQSHEGFELNECYYAKKIPGI